MLLMETLLDHSGNLDTAIKIYDEGIKKNILTIITFILIKASHYSMQKKAQRQPKLFKMLQN